jgi:peptidoglycan/xylan/chitin deacetylase (PgdA/CDA1 family)
MKKVLFLLIGILFFTAGYGQSNKPVKVIIKLDDFPASYKNQSTSKEVLDFLCENDVRVGIGVIASHLDKKSVEFLKPYITKKDKSGKPMFEIWHHGMYHKPFANAPYEDQKERFNMADSVVKKELGVQMHSFGAPGNSSDSITSKVISENPNYKVLIFVRAKASGANKMMYLNNRVNMENGTGKPEFDFFVENYNKAMAQSMPVMVFQGHPNMYTTPEKMEQFKKIIQFLIDKKVQFITPYDYYLENK